MTECPENSLEQLKCALNVRFAEVNDPIMLLQFYIRQGKSEMSLYRFMQRGCMLWQMMHLQK